MAQLDLEDVGLTDRYNRNRANENFRKIQKAFNDLQTGNESLRKQIVLLDESQKNLDKRISDNQEAIADWSERVKHIVLGTDPETIELVVTKILEEKGLI